MKTKINIDMLSPDFIAGYTACQDEDKTKLKELLTWIEEFDNKNFKPTHTNMKEKIWQLLSPGYELPNPPKV